MIKGLKQFQKKILWSIWFKYFLKINFYDFGWGMGYRGDRGDMVMEIFGNLYKRKLVGILKWEELEIL